MKIHVNQTGYFTTGKKQAVASGENLFKGDYLLFDMQGNRVLTISPAEAQYDENSGEESLLLDFSDFSDEGRYYLLSGDKSTLSYACIISKNPYESLLNDALKMFYFQRCGTELKPEYAGVYTHKACHCDKVKLLYGDREFNCSGGWHDAGDFGRYVTAGAVAVGHLLYAYDFSKFSHIFEKDKMNLNIPESGNDIPDILNECRYELEWFLKMQEEDGGVHHKCTSMRHTSFVMPEDDPLPFVVTPVSSLATADFAAVCAYAARLYRKYDEAFADKLATAAALSGEWLLHNPDYLFENPKEVSTGDYSDPCDLDERLWAHAELYKLTKDSRYLPFIESILKFSRGEADYAVPEKTGDYLRRFGGRLPLSLIGWQDVGGLAALAIINDSEDIFEKLIAEYDFFSAAAFSWRESAEYLRKIAESNSYRLAMKPRDFLWGSNLTVLNNAVIFAMNYKFGLEDKDIYKNLALSQLDYLLGKNALDVSYVTGYGSNPVKNPHNRPTYADGIEAPIPGYVSGGPNYGRMDDAAKKNIPEGTPGMKAFTDDAWSYSTNEITIYWNSPLVLLFSLLS